MATEEGLRPIEGIKPGDRVWSYDVVASAWRLCRVTVPYSLQYKGTAVRVTAAGETVESTYRHPYWVLRGEALAYRPWLEHLAFIPPEATTPGRWVDACDLRAGDELLLRDGRQVPVQRLELVPFAGTVYNMEVEDLQSYAVGLNSILVHNQNSSDTGPGGGTGNEPSTGTGVPSRPGTANGERAGKGFTARGKEQVKQENRGRNNGVLRCDECGVECVPGQRLTAGGKKAPNEAQVDHIIPKSQGGDGSPSNGQVLCERCNQAKRDRLRGQ